MWVGVGEWWEGGETLLHPQQALLFVLFIALYPPLSLVT